MGKKQVLLIEDMCDEGFTAGPKAHRDVRAIMHCDTFYCYFRRAGGVGSYLYSSLRFLACLPSLFSYKHIIIQYPFYTNWRFNEICYRLLPKKSILLVHDIPSLRYENGEKEIQHEIKQMNRFAGMIMHNNRMEEWLREHGVTTRMVKLGLFDYLVQEVPEKKEKTAVPWTVVFAGNLGKSQFIDKLAGCQADGLHFAFYGISPTEFLKESGCYRGVEESDVLPEVLDGHFGLVWDGNFEEECQETASRYLQYNCPHKFSLYMAAGIPVIVGKKSALAGFVEEHGLGICVGNLGEIREKLARVTVEEYREMCSRVQSVKEKVRNGDYLREALWAWKIEV